MIENDPVRSEGGGGNGVLWPPRRPPTLLIELQVSCFLFRSLLHQMNEPKAALLSGSTVENTEASSRAS